MTQQQTIPEGYRVDAQKRLDSREVMIKPIDLERDALVLGLVEKASAASDVPAKFKASAFGDIEAFVELSAEQYGAQIGGKKGNVSLISFDGRFKIMRAVQESIAFDERLQAARAVDRRMPT